MCGEKIVLDWSAGEDEGITPACAGKRQDTQFGYPPGKDHPRMCGEKDISFAEYSPSLGSPPHARGKGNLDTDSGTQLRITPACAGKSSHQPDATHLEMDHPRMCGEKRP